MAIVAGLVFGSTGGGSSRSKPVFLCVKVISADLFTNSFPQLSVSLDVRPAESATFMPENDGFQIPQTKTSTVQLRDLVETEKKSRSSQKITVEWAPDESVTRCTGCSEKFTFTKRKHHCRKCGKIFCGSCCNSVGNGERSCATCSNFDARWVPDESVINCSRCLEDFTLTKRRHHCRKCGQIFCGSCCNYLFENERHCETCYKKSIQLSWVSTISEENPFLGGEGSEPIATVNWDETFNFHFSVTKSSKIHFKLKSRGLVAEQKVGEAVLMISEIQTDQPVFSRPIMKKFPGGQIGDLSLQVTLSKENPFLKDGRAHPTKTLTIDSSLDS